MEVDWALLESNQRLQREKGAREAAKALAEGGAAAAGGIEERASALLGHATWEGRHGGLLLLQECLRWRAQSGQNPPDCARWVDACLGLLGDKEPRLRTVCGETVATLCELGGRELYTSKVSGPLLSAIEGNLTLERDGQAFLDDDEATKALAEKLLAGEAAQEAKKAAQKAGSRASRASSVQSTIFHDTAGWGSLETDVACLAQIIQRCGTELAPCIVSEGEALEVLLSGAAHLNRFVRGTAFRAIEAAIQCLQHADTASAESQASEELLLDRAARSTDLVTRICAGVCDEWANVRMDASVALRAFMLALGSPQRQERHFDEVLPRMCVNRYYVAAGVASYSQETWRLVLGARGREVVVKWLPSIVPFYVLQTRVAVSEAREAACKCVGELAARVDAAAVSPYAVELFQALIPRLNRKDAWQVKLAACTAVTEIVRAFPDRFHLSADFPKMSHYLSALLADTVWSVRERGAVVLGEMVKVSDAAAVRSVLDLCLEGLTAASKEADERKKYGQDDPSALKRERDNDASLHENQETIDCCAVGDLDQDDSEQLAPTTGKLNLSAVYMQSKEEQEALGLDHWERTDGCLYLARELALCGQWRSRASAAAGGEGDARPCLEDLLEKMAKVASHRHFYKHLTLLTTLWKLLPEIVRAAGAREFGSFLGPFAEHLVYSLSSQDGLVASAAKDCVSQLGQLRGREEFTAYVRGRCGDGLEDSLLACLAPE